MKKIAILTRKSTHNYGTLLQCYALQKVIASMDADVQTIDEQRLIKDYLDRKKPVRAKVSLKRKMYDRYEKIRSKYFGYQYRPQTKKLFIRFQQNHIRYDRPRSTAYIDRKYDIIISGSDQIWAEAAEPILFPFYMQDFAGDDKVKASYAVSVGSDYSPQNIPDVKRYLSSFDFLSVREPSSAEILKQYTDKEIVLSCDPVLLLPESNWSELAGDRNHEEKYIFCFFLANHEWYFTKVDELLKEYPGRKVYFFSKKDISHPEYQQIPDSSPEEFLNYIKYADFVLTDSYHAFLFSMIFHKNLNVLERFHNVENNSQNGRILDLMERLGITDKFSDEQGAINTDEIDYERAHQKMLAFREDSMRYLSRVLFFNKEKDSAEKR